MKIRYCPATVSPNYCHDYAGLCFEIIRTGRRLWFGKSGNLVCLNCRLTREGWGDRKRY